MTIHEITLSNLTASGYGIPEEELKPILAKLTEKELKQLMYNAYRTAEKKGIDYLDAEYLGDE